jgi:hypothetical protein
MGVSMTAWLAEDRLLEEAENMKGAWEGFMDAVCLALEGGTDLAHVDQAEACLAAVERRAWLEVAEARRLLRARE